jgi:hypothetical protein
MNSAFMNHNPHAVIEGDLVEEAMVPPGEEVILAETITS